MSDELNDRGRDKDGNPNVLWISKEAIAITLEDTMEGDGVKYIRADSDALRKVREAIGKALNESNSVFIREELAISLSILDGMIGG